MKTIVRRDSGEDWHDYLRRFMQEEGLLEAGQEPTAEDRRRFDKSRKNKKVSNENWEGDPAQPELPYQTAPDWRFRRKSWWNRL